MMFCDHSEQENYLGIRLPMRLSLENHRSQIFSRAKKEISPINSNTTGLVGTFIYPFVGRLILTHSHLRAPDFYICKASYQNHKLYTRHLRICMKEHFLSMFLIRMSSLSDNDDNCSQWFAKASNEVPITSVRIVCHFPLHVCQYCVMIDQLVMLLFDTTGGQE